jgi:hypothetical protein
MPRMNSVTQKLRERGFTLAQIAKDGDVPITLLRKVVAQMARGQPVVVAKVNRPDIVRMVKLALGEW